MTLHRKHECALEKGYRNAFMLLETSNINFLSPTSSFVEHTSNFYFFIVKLYKMVKSSFQTIIIIQINLTNLIAAFHGMYLLAAQSHSFQFLFSFWVEHGKKGLRIMLNIRC